MCWNYEEEVHKEVKMSPAFVAAIVEAVGSIRHMFQVSSERWESDLMLCKENAWPFHSGDKLSISLRYTESERRIKIFAPPWGGWWVPGPESQEILLSILIPMIHDTTREFLLPSVRQLVLETMDQAFEKGLSIGHKELLKEIMPRLELQLYEKDFLEEVFESIGRYL